MAPRIKHYNVQFTNNEHFRVHFNNVDSDDESSALKKGLKGVLPSTETVGHVKKHFKRTENFYRKMSNAEVTKTLENRGLVGQIRGTNSRKYITDSFDKAFEFTNNILSKEKQKQSKILKMKVSKDYYKSFKESCIPQRNANKVNPTANVFNMEGIKNPIKQNIGIHQKKLPEFNKNIKDILVLNPQDATVKNKFLRYVSNHKLETCLVTLSIIIEGYNIYIAICEDGGIGKKTVVHGSGLAGSILGSKIGATIGSIVPGLGTAVGCFIGGVIGSLCGSAIADFFCSFFSPPPDGPDDYEGPPPIFIPLIYGTAECEFQNVTVQYNKIRKYNVLENSLNLNVSNMITNVVEGATNLFNQPLRRWEFRETQRQPMMVTNMLYVDWSHINKDPELPIVTWLTSILPCDICISDWPFVVWVLSFVPFDCISSVFYDIRWRCRMILYRLENFYYEFRN